MLAQDPNSRIDDLGFRVLGLGIAFLASVCLVWRIFDPGQSVPDDLPAHELLAVVVAILLLVAGLGLEWSKTIAWAAAALVGFYFGFAVFLMNGSAILQSPRVYGAYSNTAEQLAIAAATLIVFATHRDTTRGRAPALIRAGQIIFGICAVLFGGAHFVYMNLTAYLVPTWLPPGQVFWGYATGIFHIAGGLAIIARVHARLAATLLTVMYILFTPLALLPQLVADPSHSRWWTEIALNIALVGAAWTVRDSLPRGPMERPLGTELG